MFPVNLVGFQNLLQVTQQLLHSEDHSQLEHKHRNNIDKLQLFVAAKNIMTDKSVLSVLCCSGLKAVHLKPSDLTRLVNYKHNQ